MAIGNLQLALAAASSSIVTVPLGHSHLAALLSAFDPPDPQQEAYQRRMMELASDDGDPTSRHTYAPGHFTASGFIAAPNGAGLLLVHHQKIGKWLQPGGHIEPTDATIEDAVRREVGEESGLTELDSFGLLDIDIHRFPARGSDPAHLHFDIRLGMQARSGIISPGDGTLDVRWVLFAEVRRWNPELSVTRPARALQNLLDRRRGRASPGSAACR